MPPVGRKAKLSPGQGGELKCMTLAHRESGNLPEREYRRKNLWRPKNCLCVERFLRISCEKKVPIAVGKPLSHRSKVAHLADFDSPFGSFGRGAATPMQYLQPPPF